MWEHSPSIYVDYLQSGFFLQKKENPISEQLFLRRFLLFPCPISQVGLLSELLLLCIFVDLHLLFTFWFSSCKRELALRTADLNVLRQEDLSFVPMKLIEISFM